METNTRSLKPILRENWYLVLPLILLLAVSLFKFTTASEAAPAPTVQERIAQDTRGIPADINARRDRTAQREPTLRSSPQEEAKEIIARHEKRLEENPPERESAALLNAIGNMYLQRLGQYQDAATTFESLLSQYPDWQGARRVYPKLAVCYERMNDDMGAVRVYQRMVKIFPPDSQEYLFARQQMGL